MKTLQQRIFEGETAEQLFISDGEFNHRLEVCERFRAETTLAVWDDVAYFRWLNGQPEGDITGNPTPKPTMPSPVQRLGNLAGSMLEVLKSEGAIFCDKQTAATRNEICEANACGKFLDGFCAVCGCLMKVKTSLEAMKCPEGHW